MTIRAINLSSNLKNHLEAHANYVPGVRLLHKVSRTASSKPATHSIGGNTNCKIKNRYIIAINERKRNGQDEDKVKRSQFKMQQKHILSLSRILTLVSLKNILCPNRIVTSKPNRGAFIGIMQKKGEI